MNELAQTKVSSGTSLREALKHLKPHDHLCLIYESPEEWKNAVIPFVRIGLEKGEKCLYIIDTRKAGEVIKSLQADGLDPQPFLESGALSIIDQSEAYTKEAAFDPDTMIARIIAETKTALAEGFSALRITGEMSWILRGHPGSDRLVEYEAKLNRDVFSRHPCLALCQYDMRKCAPETIKAAILTHPLLVYENRIYRNFYCLPAEDFSENRQPDLEIRHWLENIKRDNLNETRNKVFLESTAEMIFLKDEQYRYIFANRPFLEFFGKREDEVLGRTDFDFMPPETAESCRLTDEEALSRGGLVEKEQIIDGHIFEMRKFPVPRSQDRTGIGGIVRDITDRKAAEEAVRKSARRYREFFRTSRDCIFITSPEGRWLDFNDAAVELLGYPDRDSLSATGIQDTYANPEERRRLLDLLEVRDFLKDHPLDLKRGDGRVIHCLISVAVLRDAEGRIEALQGTIRDVTEQKRAEKRLRAAVREKDILLREIHHRVKNNMQIISSLLSLQARAAGNSELKKILAVSQGRLKSMALIHEKLYQSKDFSAVDFGSYCEFLAAHLFSISSAESHGIRLDLQVQDIRLDINRAIPCGLIVNELMSNALIHAFPGDRTGQVCVDMKNTGNGRYELTVSDDGCGLPAGIDVAKPATLGLQIVRDLVEQIDGALSHTSSGAGTSFTIRF